MTNIDTMKQRGILRNIAIGISFALLCFCLICFIAIVVLCAMTAAIGDPETWDLSRLVSEYMKLATVFLSFGIISGIVYFTYDTEPKQVQGEV